MGWRMAWLALSFLVVVSGIKFARADPHIDYRPFN